MADEEKPTGEFLWDKIRKKGRKELDQLQRSTSDRPSEKREFAGDPAQRPYLRIKLRRR